MADVYDLFVRNRPSLTEEEIMATGTDRLAVSCALAVGENFVAIKVALADGREEITLMHPLLATHIVQQLRPIADANAEENRPLEDGPLRH